MPWPSRSTFLQASNREGKTANRTLRAPGARFVCRKGEVEGRAFSRLSLGPHPAAVALDDPLHRGQADAVALKLVSTGEPLEGDKQFVRMGHVKTRPVVPDKTGRLAGNVGHADFDDGFSLPGGILPGIAEEVRQHHPQ